LLQKSVKSGKASPWWLICLVVFFIGVRIYNVYRSYRVRPNLIGNQTLREARSHHKTRLLIHGPAPQDFSTELPDGVRRVTYTSQGRTLMAWLAMPTTPGPHPAVLFAHGGFALGTGDYDDAKPFVDAGFVVLMPTWRGENGNPGEYERVYGEIDDASAALDYLATVSGVDPSRLFATGHSMGGSTAMLLAEVSTRLRGAASCGGFPDIAAVVDQGQKLDNDYPYDWHDPLENDLRSPGRHLKDLHCPLAVYNSGSDSIYVTESGWMVADARRYGKSVTIEVFDNTDHHSALAPAVRKMIVEFEKE
jgi:dipeptidyl aminopeptidase/acylaminoacyl peptidase